MHCFSVIYFKTTCKSLYFEEIKIYKVLAFFLYFEKLKFFPILDFYFFSCSKTLKKLYIPTFFLFVYFTRL